MDILVRKFVMLHFFASYSDARKLMHDLVPPMHCIHITTVLLAFRGDRAPLNARILKAHSHSMSGSSI